MRTQTVSGVTFEYPDEVSFCFNPVVVNIRGVSYEKLVVTITDVASQKSYAEVRAMFGTACFFDLSQYMQSAFVTENMSKVDYSVTGAVSSETGRKYSVTVDMYNGGTLDNSFAFDTFVVWGAMKIGERYNGDRKLTWFKHYPFSVGLYSAASGNVRVTADGAYLASVAVAGQKVNNLLLNGIEADNEAVFYLPGSATAASVFDHTFDFTFRGLLNTPTKITCKVDDSEEGVYLRWINRHGMYCYWLFIEGDETKQVTNDGEFIRNNMQDYNYVNGYHGGTGRKQRKSEETTMPIGAPLVDSDTYDFLFQLATSPVVDMYCGKDYNGVDCWKAVNVSVGSYVKTRKVLQDFEAVILMPETSIQSL